MVGNVHGPEKAHIVTYSMQKPIKEILRQDQHQPVNPNITNLEQTELVAILQQEKGTCFSS
ncbi:hypothetical protein D3C85_1097000 [compost metagenome]